MQLAARQMLRALRGKRSQVAFSRRLGYRGNPVANWEAGRRTPTIHEVLRACERIGIDVEGAFERFFPTTPAAPLDPVALSDWLDSLRGTTPIRELAERSGCSRYTVSRWLSGRCQPRLHEFLILLEAITGRACDWVAEFVAIDQVPELHAPHLARVAARRLAHEEPWTEAILRVLESRQCQPGDAARQLGIDEDTERRCLEKLVLAGIVTQQEDGLEVVGELTVDTRAVPQLKAHWATVARDRATSPNADDLFSYNVLSVAPEDLAVIRERLRGAYREIRAIVSNSTSTECVALVNLQLVNWEQPREVEDKS